MRIELSAPELLPELIERLVRSDCIAQVVDERACLVDHVLARDADEARGELLFFLRTWRTLHPEVNVRLVA